MRTGSVSRPSAELCILDSPLYGQCRSINNATLAEVKGGLRVWGCGGGADKESEVMGARRKH